MYLDLTSAGSFPRNQRVQMHRIVWVWPPFSLRQSSNMAASKFVTSAAHTLYALTRTLFGA